jgi:excisionase family DNA binding protein
MVNKRLVTVIEAAEMLSISPKTMWAWIYARKVETVHLGRSVRVPASELERLIEEGTIPALPAGTLIGD